MVFVCTNERAPGQRISCGGAGRCGQEILDQLKKYVKEHKLEDKVRVAKSGCQEQCEQGPSVMVMPGNIHLSGVQVSDVDKILQQFFAPIG
jgi:(2Fe-2S) ferredoxin